MLNSTYCIDKTSLKQQSSIKYTSSILLMVNQSYSTIINI